jgi:hypothetical protein
VLLEIADEGGLSVFRQCHEYLHARPSPPSPLRSSGATNAAVYGEFVSPVT